MVRRSMENPILTPIRGNSWEAYATFNPSVVRRDRRYYMLYRAVSSSDLLKKQNSSFSSIGIAESADGIHFTKRRCFIRPEFEWERFGCEDPRVTFIDGKYYIFYTAISTIPPRPEGIRVGVAVSSDLKSVEGKYLVTPFNAKAMALFPRRINGKLTAVLTVHTDMPPAYICIAQLGDDPSVWYTEMEEWYREFKDWALRPDPRRSPRDHIEVGAPPIEVEEGWLLIYSYIQNYFGPESERVFGVEALILDRDDPRKVVAQTQYPFMVPEEVYEIYGHVPRVIFPTSVIRRGKILRLYYGATDTVCCLAMIGVNHLRKILKSGLKSLFRRSPSNPIIKPDKRFPWRGLATFNPAAIELDGMIYILFRALSEDKTSTIGLAISEDGLTVKEILDKPIYVPREPFEMKLTPGHSGCEDPRVVRIGDTIYMFYTAYDNVNPPKVAVTSISVDDFLNRNWGRWSKPKIVSPPGMDDKDACIIPEPVNGRYFFIHRVGGVNIVYDYVSSPEAINPLELISNVLLGPRPGMWDGKKVGLATPPIKTKKGWLMIYHGVSHDNSYHVGAALLDINQPEKVIARTTSTLLSPEAWYEREGYVRNVVFPCGAIVRDETLYLYYGGADTYVCVATAPIDEILAEL